MSDKVFAITALIWAILVGLAYIRAGRTLPKVAADGIPDPTPTCLGLAHLLLVSNFGKRYWTWRGLLFTTALCWGYATVLFASQGPYRFGASGYPVIEYFVLGVMALLPLWVHAIVHTTRVFLDVVGPSESLLVKTAVGVLLPVVPAMTLAITLFPIAVVAGMADAQSFVPRAIGGNWIALVEMATLTWWLPRETGSFPLVFVPLGLPAISCGLHVASYVASWTLCTPGRAPIRQPSFLVGRQVFVTGILHVSFVLCWGLTLLLDRASNVP